MRLEALRQIGQNSNVRLEALRQIGLAVTVGQTGWDVADGRDVAVGQTGLDAAVGQTGQAVTN